MEHQEAIVNEAPETETQAEREVVMYTFTNKANTAPLESILAMFYTGTDTNTVGIMEAFNLATEEEELVLVGVQADENGKPMCFPLAKVLRAEDVSNYLSPDGKGGYFDPFNEPEAAAAREDMKSIVEATGDLVEIE